MSVTMQNVLAKVSLVPTHVRILRNKMLIHFYFYGFISTIISQRIQTTSDAQLFSRKRAHHHK